MHTDIKVLFLSIYEYTAQGLVYSTGCGVCVLLDRAGTQDLINLRSSFRAFEKNNSL